MRFGSHIGVKSSNNVRAVQKNKQRNNQRMTGLKRQEEREISLDYLMPEIYFELPAMDSHFKKQDETTVFLILDKK